MFVTQDNQFFRNLLTLEWKPREWDGPLQYADTLTGELMMLPTDMALRTDASFRKWAEVYAKDARPASQSPNFPALSNAVHFPAAAPTLTLAALCGA